VGISGIYNVYEACGRVFEVSMNTFEKYGVKLNAPEKAGKRKTTGSSLHS
jgi:hypothetical protein